MSDSEDEAKEICLKFVLVGDGSTGKVIWKAERRALETHFEDFIIFSKTSIITRYSQDQFKKQYNQTLGIDFFMKRIVLPGSTNVMLQIYDIGQLPVELGSALIASLIVFSFKKAVRHWVEKCWTSICTVQM